MAEQTFELYIGSGTGAQVDAAVSKVAAMEETLSGTAATIPSSAAVKNYVDNKSVDTESTLSGDAAKIPSSKAVKDVTDTLLPKSDATFLTSKTKTYYTVFNEENTTVIEDYKYVAGDDALTASAGDKVYIYNNIDFDVLRTFGRSCSIAICDSLNGTALVNRVYSRNTTPWYGKNEQTVQTYKGKCLVAYIENAEGMYSADNPTANKLGGIIGKTSVTEAEYLAKALADNGKYAKIITALNSDGIAEDGMSNALVGSAEQKSLSGTSYVGKLSLSPAAAYSRSLFSVTFCPNITHLNIDISGNSNITRLRVLANYGLKKLRVKMNAGQSPQFYSNHDLEELIIEGAPTFRDARPFAELKALTHLDLSMLTGFTSLYAEFSACSALAWLNLTNVTMTDLRGSIPSISLALPALTTFIGDHTLSEVEAGTVTCFTDLKVSFDISSCTLLNRASLLAAIKGVYDFSQNANFDSGTTYATLTLGDKLTEKLEENDLDILIAKGWDFV